MRLSKLTSYSDYRPRCRILAVSCGISRRVTTLQVGSYNIRYENRGDSLKGNGWGQRLPIIAQQILFHDLEIFGTQEGKHRPA